MSPRVDARAVAPRSADVRDAAWSIVTTAAGLGIGIAVVSGAWSTRWWSVLVAALVVGLGDLVLRPLLRLLARLTGAPGALVVGIGAQVAVAWFALTLVPGLHARTAGDVVAVLLVAALVMALGRWAVGTQDADYLLADLRRQARRAARREARGGAVHVEPAAGDTAEGRATGLLIVQLDGLAAPTLRHAVQAGLMPNVARWLVSGTHVATPWWASVPSTTPASQAGLLHGAADQVPAFRWWDRELGRVLVTNHPRDASLLEDERLSDGRGLLADGGAAVATMFSGDAPTSLLVVSKGQRTLGAGTAMLEFAATPFVLFRTVAVTLGELLKELYQGWQQVARGVEPRVSRFGAYPVLRAITNVLLRGLATSLVAQQMMRGRPVVFVDYVDYDEIAHHAGPLRPESLRALEGLDRVVGLLEQYGRETPRPYDVVVLSDHGQSLGSTFAQAAGVSFADLVEELVAPAVPGAGRSRPGPHGGADHVPEAQPPDSWHQVAAALRALTGAVRPDEAVGPEREPEVSARTARRSASQARPSDDAPVAAASGNLGGVWARQDHALTLGEVMERWPALVPGLASHPQVGVVVGRGDDGVALAVGRRGVRRLDGSAAEGEDPLARYGERAAADLARAVALPGAADLLVVSAVGVEGTVHAFEGLVGSHGGLGGDQNQAVLVHPATWRVDPDRLERVDGHPVLVGADAVHAQLVDWLVACGARRADL